MVKKMSVIEKLDILKYYLLINKYYTDIVVTTEKH